VRDEQRIRGARQARLDQQVRVRVRCAGGALHRIELRAGRLALPDHAAAERRRLLPPTASWTDREVAMQTLPRCLQVLQAWRDASARPGHARKVKATKARPEHWRVVDTVLPPKLRAARGQTITDGVTRQRLRTWLGWAAMRADNKASRVVELAVRCEYARYARPNLLLEVPVSGFKVNACPYDPRQALGGVQPEPDPDAPWGSEVTRSGGISLGIRHNWLAALWWRGLGVVDGRLILDVWRQPHGPHAGRVVATLIDWAGYAGVWDTTTRPGWVGTTEVPLLRDQAGRWHLADPATGMTMRRVDRGRR